MPNYSYFCDNCSLCIEKFFSIKDYKEKIKCPECKKNCNRDYHTDIPSQSASVKKSDSELKTLGDLGNRNRDRMSDDQKVELHKKHNDYKEQESTKELPKGMSRIKKPKKIKWR
jgi:hypothetical protein